MNMDMMETVIDPADTKKLKFKTVVPEKCGEKHIDQEKFVPFNYQKHLCRQCNEFYDTERSVGV